MKLPFQTLLETEEQYYENTNQEYKHEIDFFKRIYNELSNIVHTIITEIPKVSSEIIGTPRARIR